MESYFNCIQGKIRQCSNKIPGSVGYVFVVDCTEKGNTSKSSSSWWMDDIKITERRQLKEEIIWEEGGKGSGNYLLSGEQGQS